MAIREGSNGFNAEQLEKYLKPIDKADDELLDLKVKHMSLCKGPRGKIRDAMATAKEAGINLVAFRELVALRRADRAQERRIADLEADDLADYNSMCEALGEFADTPLGAAALAKAKRGEETLSDLQ